MARTKVKVEWRKPLPWEHWGCEMLLDLGPLRYSRAIKGVRGWVLRKRHPELAILGEFDSLEAVNNAVREHIAQELAPALEILGLVFPARCGHPMGHSGYISVFCKRPEGHKGSHSPVRTT